MNTETIKEQTTNRAVEGNVIGAASDKSITVLVERRVKHPLYKKYIRRSTKLHAHDEENQCKAGDIVRIESCRPISKTKCWRLVEVITRAV